MAYKVEFSQTKKIDSEKKILKLAKKLNIKINAPCEKGKCGKCVVLAKGSLSKPTESEKKILGDEKLKKGYRLACETKITGDAKIKILE